MLSTVNYTSSQFQMGISGPYSTTNASGKISMYASSCAWTGWVTGTEATLLAYQNTSSQPAGMVRVSIDGGSFVDAVVSGGRYVLFSGLSNATRRIVVRINGAYGGSANFPASGNVLAVTGYGPSVTTGSHKFAYFDLNPYVDYSGTKAANFTNFLPTNFRSASGTTYGSNAATIRFRGNPTWIIANVGTNTGYVYLSKNGATRTRHVVSSVDGTATITGLDGSLATYSIWLGGGMPNFANQGSGYLCDATTLEDLSVKRMMVEFGDSITYGANSSGIGEVAILQTAAALGYSGHTSGISGNTFADVNTRIDTVLANLYRTPTSSDVASLQLGTNGSFATGWETTYGSIINKILTAGFGKVICWMLPAPTGSSGEATLAAAINNIAGYVAGLGDSRVKFLDTRSTDYANVARADGLHLTDAGYASLTLLQQRDFPALLA